MNNMKIIAITNLFPNSLNPTKGLFNYQQLKALRQQSVEVTVIAPIPWHHFSKLPEREIIDGFNVYHPRYFVMPKIGRSLYGFLFTMSLLPKIKKLYKELKFDMILSTWAYPDAFGSYLIAKALKKSIVIKIHGTDINLYTRYFLRRKMIAWALSNSDKTISVSDALKEEITKIGVPSNKIVVIPNGINTELFKPMDQLECRRVVGLPLDKKIILYAGNFEYVKGVDMLIDAFGGLLQLRDDTLLVLLGDGSFYKKLREKAEVFNMESRVIFAGRIKHDAMRYYMNASDVFCLPSRSEGCPNVVLEAMACGKPVVATKVGGIPELVSDSNFGILVTPENPRYLTDALKEALDKKWDYKEIALHVSKFTWVENAKKLSQVLKDGLSN